MGKFFRVKKKITLIKAFSLNNEVHQCMTHFMLLTAFFFKQLRLGPVKEHKYNSVKTIEIAYVNKRNEKCDILGAPLDNNQQSDLMQPQLLRG